MLFSNAVPALLILFGARGLTSLEVIKPVQSSLDTNKDPTEKQHHSPILDHKLVSLERCETLTLYYDITKTGLKEIFEKSTIV